MDQLELDKKAKQLGVFMRSLGVKLLTCGCCNGASLHAAEDDYKVSDTPCVEGFDVKQKIGDL